MEKITEEEAVRLLNEAIALAAKEMAAKRPPAALMAIMSAVKAINSRGDRKSLRMRFSRPGGSWDAMGMGCESWRLSRQLCQAAYNAANAAKAAERAMGI
jgi:hypothetical protein